MAPDAQRLSYAADGHAGEQQARLVAVRLRPFVEGHHLFARGKAAVRLPGVRGQNKKSGLKSNPDSGFF